MATVYYPAIVERAAEGYSVFFPDLPGCTSAGDTVQAAALNAEEALAGHLAMLDRAWRRCPPAV
jgi:predicted RNase H-like HicB family nuclease